MTCRARLLKGLGLRACRSRDLRHLLAGSPEKRLRDQVAHSLSKASSDSGDATRPP